MNPFKTAPQYADLLTKYKVTKLGGEIPLGPYLGNFNFPVFLFPPETEIEYKSSI